MFVHHPDGYIVINNTFLPLIFFVVFLERDYFLNPEWKGRIYIPGEKHTLIGTNTEAFLGKTWNEGDIYISKENYYALEYKIYLKNKEKQSNIIGIDKKIGDV